MDERAARNRALGASGEALAAAYFEDRGCPVLARNWRNRQGELDLIVRDGDCVVAVEVKSRNGSGYGHPFEAITARKVSRIRRLLLDWVAETRPVAQQLRIDAIGILYRPDAEPEVEHLRGIG